VVGLVNGLGMLGAQLSVMDRDDEAIEAAEECVALNRKLVAGMTEVPLSGLAKALDRLATVLVFAGRDAEALNPINEAIELYRELAARRPARYARLVESARATRAKIR
jgi:tetratricopeptide (TPR) repeat protein